MHGGGTEPQGPLYCPLFLPRLHPTLLRGHLCQNRFRRKGRVRNRKKTESRGAGESLGNAFPARSTDPSFYFYLRSGLFRRQRVKPAHRCKVNGKSGRKREKKKPEESPQDGGVPVPCRLLSSSASIADDHDGYRRVPLGGTAALRSAAALHFSLYLFASACWPVLYFEGRGKNVGRVRGGEGRVGVEKSRQGARAQFISVRCLRRQLYFRVSLR